jgi:hypothetical protein
MRRAQTNQQMDMVFNAADCFGYPAKVIDNATHIGM